MNSYKGLIFSYSENDYIEHVAYSMHMPIGLRFAVIVG